MDQTNSLHTNLRIWDRAYPWPEHGEEWKGQARRCCKAYDDWKQSAVSHLIAPYARHAVVLEIGPGHGRWTTYLAPLARQLWLVDLSPACIAFCRKRFHHFTHINYCVTDGKSLPSDLTESIDYVWSFDSFVHMDASVTFSYLAEISRVLTPEGRAVIHHPGRRHVTLGLSQLRRFGNSGRICYRLASMGLDELDDGWRSDISEQLFAEFAAAAGLRPERQLREWVRGYGVPRYRDVITILTKI